MLQSRAPAHRQLTDGAGARRAHTCPRPPHVGHGLPLRRRNRVLTFRGSWSVLTTATMISSSVLPMGKYHPVFGLARVDNVLRQLPSKFFLQCSSSLQPTWLPCWSRTGTRVDPGQKDVNSTLGRPGCLRAYKPPAHRQSEKGAAFVHAPVLSFLPNYATGARTVPGP